MKDRLKSQSCPGDMELHEDRSPLRMKNWKNLVSLLKKNTPHVKKNKSHRPNTDDVQLWSQSLENLLSHKYGRTAFLIFLKSEFCEENLEFWLKCEEFQNLTTPKELRSRAQSIYAEFVECEAPKEINLDYQTRTAVVQSLPEPTAAIFVPAQRKVYSLMENNSYPRFLQSDLYQDLCSKSRTGTQDAKAQSRS